MDCWGRNGQNASRRSDNAICLVSQKMDKEKQKFEFEVVYYVFGYWKKKEGKLSYAFLVLRFWLFVKELGREMGRKMHKNCFICCAIFFSFASEPNSGYKAPNRVFSSNEHFLSFSSAAKWVFFFHYFSCELLFIYCDFYWVLVGFRGLGFEFVDSRDACEVHGECCTFWAGTK